MFFSLHDAVSPKFGEHARSNMSGDCLAYLVKHMLTNEEPGFGFFFAIPVTSYISLGCVRVKVHVAKAHHKNEVFREQK